MGEERDRENRNMLDRALQRAGRQPHYGTPMRNPDPLFPVARSVMPRPAYEGFLEMPLDEIPERTQDDIDRMETIDLYDERERQNETERLAQGPFGRMLAPFTDWARAPETRERIGEGVNRFVEGFTGGEGATPAGDDPNTLGELGDAFGDTVRGVARSDDFLSAGSQVVAGAARSGRAISDWWGEDDNQLSLPYRMGGARSLFSVQPGAEGGPLQGYIPDFAEATTGQPWEDSDWARRGLQFENARLDAFSNNPGQGPVALDTSMRDSYADDMTSSAINAGLNLGFGALDASEVLRAPRLLSASDDLAGEIAFYRSPDGFAETSIDPDGRIVHTYQGAYDSEWPLTSANEGVEDDFFSLPRDSSDAQRAEMRASRTDLQPIEGGRAASGGEVLNWLGNNRLIRNPTEEQLAGLAELGDEMKYVMDTDGNVYAFSAADAHHNTAMRALRDNGVTVRSLGPGAEVTDPDAAGFIWRNADGSFVHEDANMVESGPYSSWAQRNAPAGRPDAPMGGSEEPDFLAGLNLREGEGGNWYVADSGGERQSDHIFGAQDDAERALSNMQNGRPEMEDGLYFDAPTNPTNDLDQWVMGEFEDGAPSRSFVLDDLVDRERSITERMASRSRDFVRPRGIDELIEIGRDPVRAGRLPDEMGDFLGPYSVGGRQEQTPLLSLGVGAAGGGAVAYALDGEAEAGDGETDENGDPLMLPILGGIAGAALASRGGRNMRSQVNAFGGSSRGNPGITDPGVRTATIRRTEPGELENTANAIADARRTLRTNRELSLRDWVAKRGGVSDDRGDLRDLNEGRVGWHRIVRESSGRQIDDLATAAWEDGYFTEIPTRDEFIEALRNNSAGRLATGLSDEAAELAVARDTLDQMDQMGVDTTLRGRRQLRESLQEIMPEAAPGRTVEETVDIAFPTDPDQWRDIIDAHPWINSPSRAQAVIMANAKRADGSFAYSADDILERTGISSSSSLNVTLSKARAAGLPIEIRNHGRAGATSRPNDMLIRALDVMESAPDISREDLARRLGTTPDALKNRLSQARQGRGTGGGRSGALPPELVERTLAIAGRGRKGGNSASAWIAGIIGGGVGGSLLFGDEADAEDEMTAEEALDAYGEASDYFGPGYRLVAPRGAPPSIQGAEFIDVSGDQAIMRAGGRVFLVRVAREAGGGPDMAPAGMQIQMLGELEPNQDAGSYSRAGPTALDEEPAGDDADWLTPLTPLRPLVSVAAGLGASRLTRNRWGGAALGGGVAMGTDFALGGSDHEMLLATLGGFGGSHFIDNTADGMRLDGYVRSPEFARRRDTFAMTLGEEAPMLRGQSNLGEIPMGSGGLSLETPRAEAIEQGYSRPIDRGMSARDQFLAARPEDQLFWMDSAEGRVARQDELLGDVRAERSALGLDNAFEVTPAPTSEARPNRGVDPTRSFPVGFFDPATGDALFGGSGRRPPPPRPRKAFDQLGPAAQARRVGSAPEQIAAARELGLGEFDKGAGAMRAIRERAAQDPAFMDMLKQRFPSIAAAILGGGAVASEVADEGDWLQ